MSARQAPQGRIVARDDAGVAAAMHGMENALQDVMPGESLLDFVARGPAMVREHVARMLEAIGDADAFDVVELMRMHEMPVSLEGFRESLAQGRPAAVDLVAVLLLARGERSPQAKTTSVTPVASVVPELHARAGSLLSIGQFRLLADGLEDKYGPLTTLAATFVGHDINVKVRQYTHIARRIDEDLFGSAHLGTLLLDELGFDYEDFVGVRESIARVLHDGFARHADVLADVATEWHASGRSKQVDERIEQGRRAVDAMLMHPAARATFTSPDISTDAGIDVDRVARVLELFSVPLEAPSDPVAAVQDFLAGLTPFRHASLLRDDEGNHVMLNVPIGTDCLRQVVEKRLKAAPRSWKRYERRRAIVSEQLTAEHLTSILGVPPAHVNLKYLRPNAGVAAASRSADARDLSSIAEQTEADILYIVEDVAICVEVKARSFSEQARSGNVQRLSADLRATVMDATNQALRLETLIRENHGLWLEDRTWLDLSGVREVRSIAVCLDDLGPIGIALDELVRAGVVTTERFPWIVSLHDLAVVAELVERPAEFLLYLRRRTESEASLLFAASDELDLFMLFLSGQLYVEPDPDRVSEEFLGVARPTRGARRRFLESAVPTRVMTHTDELDAWIYFEHGESSMAAPKPAFAADRRLLELVDFLAEDQKPGWFRFAADLFNLAEDAQNKVARAIRDVAEQTRRDGRIHTAFIGFAGAWGYPTLYIGSRPAMMSLAGAAKRLITYALAKKHQIRSDRALVILVDERGAFQSVRYVNAPVGDVDGDLDELIDKLGLLSPEAMARAVPPSARRATRRVKPKRKHKRR